MAATAFVRARIDEKLKNETTEVLAGMGLTVSDVVCISLTKIAKEKALPFDMRTPNKLTAETLAKSERGENVHHVKTPKTCLISWASDAHSRLFRAIQTRCETGAKTRQGHEYA